MARSLRNPLLSRTFQRAVRAMTRTAVRAGSKAMAQALRPAPGPATARRAKPLLARPKPARPKAAAKHADAATGLSHGMTVGAMRYRLYKPPGVLRSERLPILVMLHGCGQDPEALAASSRMNQIAARGRFLVLYPMQDRFANLQGCWNWFDTRAGRAQREADALGAMIDLVCQTQPVDPARVALAGLSAGASMAALLAVRQPHRFRAVVMHSGIAPGLAHSSATALAAMRGRRSATPLGALAPGQHLPALLVIQGSADPIVAPGNGAEAARLWAVREGAVPGAQRTVQRGKRYASTVTDYRVSGRHVATLCLVEGLGHAWSGGAPGMGYSDPKGPDASRMIWSFASRQFAGTRSA